MKYCIFIILIFISLMSISKADENNIKTALIIIDIQDFYFPGGKLPLEKPEEASLNAKEILNKFRQENQIIVHVRHESSKGFDINKNVAPLDGEKIITKKEINSFNKTELLEYLKSNGITRLILVGMQTHMCLEATTRAAHDFGFECIVVEDACTTRDLKFGNTIVKASDVHASTLATLEKNYAKIINIDEFKSNFKKFIYSILSN